jgi:hypothetical protein
MCRGLPRARARQCFRPCSGSASQTRSRSLLEHRRLAVARFCCRLQPVRVTVGPAGAHPSRPRASTPGWCFQVAVTSVFQGDSCLLAGTAAPNRSADEISAQFPKFSGIGHGKSPIVLIMLVAIVMPAKSQYRAGYLPGLNLSELARAGPHAAPGPTLLLEPPHTCRVAGYQTSVS